MLLAGLSRRCRYDASKEFLYPLGGFYALILVNAFKRYLRCRKFETSKIETVTNSMERI